VEEVSVAVPSDGVTEGCRCCLGREFQSTGAWWVKDLSVNLRRERIERTLWSYDIKGASIVRLD